MKEEETYLGEWPVKPYYKRDLAVGYAPDITPVAALNRLSAWIHHHKLLYYALLDSGYVERRSDSAAVGMANHVSTCRLMHTYVSPHTYVRMRRCHRMCKLGIIHSHPLLHSSSLSCSS